MEAPREKPLSVELTSTTQLPENTNCLVCSEDGQYLSLGHSQGLSVWCASSLTCVAQWLQDQVEITSIQIAKMADTAYLLCCVDDMGVARAFAYHCKDIHLLTVMNIMENVNKRSICLTFEVSESGDYGAASFSCNSVLWLEVYHFPVEAWLKELEMVEAQEKVLSLCPGLAEYIFLLFPFFFPSYFLLKNISTLDFMIRNPSEDVSVEFSPVAALIKIHPPKPGADPLASHMAEFLTHCLGLDSSSTSSIQQEQHAFNRDVGKTNETSGSSRRCTQHFLLACAHRTAMSPCNGRVDTVSQVLQATAHKGQRQGIHPGSPIAICVWWCGSYNLFQYSLQKAPKNQQDVACVPDKLWPNAEQILCSAVSRCSRYIALGLADGLVSVLDRIAGSQLSVVPAPERAFSRIQFLPVSSDSPKGFNTSDIHLLVLCKSGSILTVTMGRSTHPCVAQLTERPKHSGDLPTVAAAIAFLQNSSLVVQRNGKVFVQDVVNGASVCYLLPPAWHAIASPCNPVYALNSKLETLFIRGDRDPSIGASAEGGSQSLLLLLRFGESDILKQRCFSFLDSLVNSGCDHEQRGRAVDESDAATWARLHEEAVKIQERRSRAANK